MKQKKCPQCKNLIPITAPTCLYCGRPNKFVTRDYINRKWNKENSKNTIFYNIFTFKYLLFIITFLLVIFIILFN